ncbi:Arm DNA-binding domain-containing protein [Enterobacter roggenkampii]|uniref:Arm DNA-binding domain-containing protein n=1 Tax=Enterobacter roggenkampii TaxID=1812935 RepID=UPI001C970294
MAIGHWPEVGVTLARKIAMEHNRLLATGTDPNQKRENKIRKYSSHQKINLTIKGTVPGMDQP